MERCAVYNPLNVTTLARMVSELEERVTALEDELSEMALWKPTVQEHLDHIETKSDTIQGTLAVRAVRGPRSNIITSDGLPAVVPTAEPRIPAAKGRTRDRV
ncbi:hypothetical protein MTO96_027483 [Rhipicephalus appendiculatus]